MNGDDVLKGKPWPVSEVQNDVPKAGTWRQNHRLSVMQEVAASGGEERVCTAPISREGRGIEEQDKARVGTADENLVAREQKQALLDEIHGAEAGDGGADGLLFGACGA